MKKFVNKLDSNIIAWFLASFFATFVFGKNWTQGALNISLPIQILAYALCLLITKKIYKKILDI